MKVLLFGASGSGTTTLGIEIEKRINFKHLDVDDYYWKNTPFPFAEKIPLAIRNKNLTADFVKVDDVIVSGSLVGWGKEWQTAFDLVVFIRLENKERMERLKKREIERYGNKLMTDERIQQNSKAFLEWANQYENPNFKGRSLKVHNDWIELLNCTVLRLDGKTTLNENTERIMKEIKKQETLPGS